MQPHTHTHTHTQAYAYTTQARSRAHTHTHSYTPTRPHLHATLNTDASTQERTALYTAAIDTLCQLHATDTKAAGLGWLVRRGGYQGDSATARHLFELATDPPPGGGAAWLATWLDEAMPADEVTTLVHGDVSMHNFLFEQTRPVVAAVTDFGVASLGHPASDLASVTLPYAMASSSLRESPVALYGGVAEKELVDHYVEGSGFPSVREHHDYFQAFACLRAACGLTARHAAKYPLDQPAPTTTVREVEMRVASLVETGRECAKRYDKSGPGRLTRAVGVGHAFQ